MKRRRDEWRQVVRGWKRSGLTAAKFAAEEGVNVQTLYSWKYRLAREGAADVDGAAAPATSAIVEVRAAARDDGQFTIELGGGKTLRVPTRFDATELRRLLSVLEAT
jgi:transposase